MGAIVNGLTLHDFRAYGATFLMFSDYMRGSVRLAALMQLPSIFVFTHDSIGLGEDGPTHQPIEQLAGHARRCPALSVIRPAGANETALAWRHAIASHRPSDRARVLAPGNPRPGIPRAVPDDAVERGAYVLRDSFKEPRAARADPDRHRDRGAHLREARAELLEADGIATRVVSMPCMEHFAARMTSYREQVLPPACRARVSVEAASHVRLGPVGRRRRARRSGWRASAPRRRPERFTSTSESPRSGWRTAAATW